MNNADKRFACYPLFGFCLVVGLILTLVWRSPKPRPAAPVHAEGLLDAPVPDFALHFLPPDAAPPVMLSDFHDKNCIVLYFLSSQCGLCRILHARVSELAAKSAARNVKFFGVHCSATDPPALLRKWTRDNRPGFPLLEDTHGTLVQYFQVRHTPTFAVIDQHGILRYLGAFDDAPTSQRVTQSYVALAVESALANRPAAIKTHPALGCLLTPLSRMN